MLGRWCWSRAKNVIGFRNRGYPFPDDSQLRRPALYDQAWASARAAAALIAAPVLMWATQNVAGWDISFWAGIAVQSPAVVFVVSPVYCVAVLLLVVAP